jgi:predicted regulator of Ras-like GTPase activity (Roadblock/LC7/MglB family)
LIWQDARNVVGMMLINSEGIPIKTSLDSSVTAQVSI